MDTKNKKIIVLGAGGHAKVLVHVLHALKLNIHGILDKNPSLQGTNILSVPVLGTDAYLDQFNKESVVLINAVGSTGLPLARKKVFEKYKTQGFHFLSVIHPSAILPPETSLEEGVQIMAGVVLQPGVLVGQNTILNTGVVIDHDTHIGAHCHIAPGATLSGSVQVGHTTHIGTGATVIQTMKIGSECLIGAGAVVYKEVPNRHKVLSAPSQWAMLELDSFPTM